MPTKDELTAKLKEAEAQVEAAAKVEAALKEELDAERRKVAVLQEAAEKGDGGEAEALKAKVGSLEALLKVGEPEVPGAYWKTEGEKLQRVAEGTWRIVQEELDANIGSLVVTDEEAAAALEADSAMTAKDARIEMLTQDVTRLEIERNDARGEVQRLKSKLRDAGTLHGSIDNLPGVVG